MTTTSILVVEDERIIAKGIEKQLKGLGYVVAGSAATGEEAVAKADALRPDLILMDISLGDGMDGVAAAALIRRRIDVPVVYLTANSDAATLERAKLSEPHGFVLKPYEDIDLRTAIEIGVYKHRMDRRLRENEQWLAATLGSIGDGVIATDELGRVRYMNRLAEELTGWPQADAAGREVGDVFRIVERRTRAVVPNPAVEALRTGRPTDLAPNTVLVARGGAERPIDDSAAPIRALTGAVSGAVLVFRDITERRRLEEHLVQAQKMEAVGRLAGGIAHDFNNIMTVITGFGEMLLLGDRPPDRWRQYVQTIHDAGQRAAALTAQIMAFSRKQMLVPTVLNLNAVVRDMGQMVQRLIGSNIAFEAHPAADLGAVLADPTQMGQIVLNLAANARDAMPHGGRLVLSTANAALTAETTRRHPDVPPGRYALLSVRDTGTGIPPDVLEHIFEPFFTTKGVGQGTGLGLATVYGIVKQSGGHLVVDSTVGEGTTFRVYLPLVTEAAAAAPGPDTRPAATGSETVLLVEDDEAVRAMTKTILERSGYTVLDAAHGRDAVALAEGHPTTIHLLLTDLIMPHMSGREVGERLAALRPDMRVMYMSAYTEDVIVRQGVESDAADFLHKPFTIDALTRKVRQVLDRA